MYKKLRMFKFTCVNGLTCGPDNTHTVTKYIFNINLQDMAKFTDNN